MANMRQDIPRPSQPNRILAMAMRDYAFILSADNPNKCVAVAREPVNACIFKDELRDVL